MIFMAPVAEDFGLNFELDCSSNLFCAEDYFGSEPLECHEEEDATKDVGGIVEEENQNHLWHDGELDGLVEKEKQFAPHPHYVHKLSDSASPESVARHDALLWIFKVYVHYGFDPVTAILSITYLDRFLSANQFQHDKPWMTQLAAVACISLAAKMEETEVPLLLDLQVEDAKYVFEPKTIQRMELLVLSTLDWRMTSVTPLSYLDHAGRILGIKGTDLSYFISRSKDILLNALTDARILRFLPSVVAVSIMLYVMREHGNGSELLVQENKLLEAIKADKEECERCMKILGLENPNQYGAMNGLVVGFKRKRSTSGRFDFEDSRPGSPNGVLDASFSCSSGQSTPGGAYSSSPSLGYEYEDPMLLTATLSLLIKKKQKSQDQFYCI